MSQIKRKKILFVTHALEGVYGAATSLRMLLENYPGIDADLLLPRSFLHPPDLEAIARRFPSVRRAYELSMPTDLGLLGIRRGLADMAHGAAHWLAWRRDRARYERLMREEKYDIVHFNSPILHHMVLPGIPAVIHMRDIILDAQSTVVDKLADSRGIVFIDAATRHPFARRESSMRAITLNNPFDMRGVATAEPFRHASVDTAKTIFSMIGRVSEIKRVALVIEAFRRNAGPDVMLLIVGSGPQNYMAHCRIIAGGDPRIIFWGEEKNIMGLYALTDYVVRGDPQPCVGRTVYEGLYAGCRVIMPGPGEPGMVFEAERFSDSIFWYAPGDKAMLARVFAACGGKKVGAREYRSNVADYVQTFDGFMDACL